MFGLEDNIALPSHAIKYVTIQTHTACMCMSGPLTTGTTSLKNVWAVMSHFQNRKKTANLRGFWEV